MEAILSVLIVSIMLCGSVFTYESRNHSQVSGIDLQSLRYEMSQLKLQTNQMRMEKEELVAEMAREKAEILAEMTTERAEILALMRREKEDIQELMRRETQEQISQLQEQVKNCCLVAEPTQWLSSGQSVIPTEPTEWLSSGKSMNPTEPTQWLSSDLSAIPTKPPQWLSSGHSVNKSIGEVLNTLKQRNNRVDLYHTNHWTYRFSMINNELWVPFYNNKSIHVFNTDRNVTIKLINNLHPLSVYQSGNSVLLAAAEGLYVIDMNGNVQYQVTSGRISDIYVSGDLAVGYNFSNNHIFTANLTGSRWQIQNSFPASESDRDYLNTIQMTNNIIYLASYFTNNIQSYTLDGQFVHTYTQQLYWPFLCGSDHQGSVLVCDYGNHLLKVLTPGGNWVNHQLPGIRHPFDTVTDKDGNMWVMWCGDGYYRLITKFSM